MAVARSTFAAGTGLSDADIRPYMTDGPAMMASDCSGRIPGPPGLALGPMMFPDALRLLFSRPLVGASRQADYSDSGK
jgi:hypothetical protein